jgi:predicted nucleic acid-binding Zn ribbon protein
MERYTPYHYSWWNLRGCPLLHLDSCSWAGDERCCGCACGKWMGKAKRMILRGVLFLFYLLFFLLLLPFLCLVSPYLLYHYHSDRARRRERKEWKRRRKEMEKQQREREQGLMVEKTAEQSALAPSLDIV